MSEPTPSPDPAPGATERTLSGPGDRPGLGLAAVGVAALAALGLLLLLLPAPAHAGTGAADRTPPGQSWVRAGSFVPGMGTVTVEVEPVSTGDAPVTLADAASYGEVSAYDGLPPGGYTATVRDTATSSGDAPVLSRTFEVTPGEARTVAVVGTTTDPRLVLLTDELTPPEPGTARVRLLSAAPTVPTVTVRAIDGPVLAQDAVLGEATSYATVPAGSWTLALDGTTSAANLEDVAIASGSVYTVVVLDDPDAGVALRVVSDAAGAATAPRGGAATGLGGGVEAPAAVSSSDRRAGAAVMAGGLVAGLVALRIRRRAPGGRR